MEEIVGTAAMRPVVKMALEFGKFATVMVASFAASKAAGSAYDTLVNKATTLKVDVPSIES